MQEMADTMGQLAEMIEKGDGPESAQEIGDRLRNAASELAKAAVRELTGQLRQDALELCGATLEASD